jgi:hypothetical protein
MQSKAENLYNYANVIKKIKALADKGYLFVGNITPDFVPWAALRLGLFLFIKNNKYYQFSALSLLYSPKLDVSFDEDDEPLPRNRTFKIAGDDYIYIVFIQTKPTHTKPEVLVLLRADASVTGHSFLLGPYRDKAGDIVGGEIYYDKGNLLLINPKSGSFKTELDVAVQVVEKVWGKVGVQVFYPGVEEEEIAQELLRRKQTKPIEKDGFFSLSDVTSLDPSSNFKDSPPRNLNRRLSTHIAAGLSLTPMPISAQTAGSGSSYSLSQSTYGPQAVDPSLISPVRSAATIAQKTTRNQAGFLLTPAKPSKVVITPIKSESKVASKTLAPASSASILSNQRLFNPRNASKPVSTKPKKESRCVIL